MAEGARLESVYTVTPYRGFESLSLRQIKKGAIRPLSLFAVRKFGFEPSIFQIDGFDKIVGNDFEQHRSRDAGPEGVAHREVRHNPSLAQSLSVSMPSVTLVRPSTLPPLCHIQFVS